MSKKSILVQLDEEDMARLEYLRDSQGTKTLVGVIRKALRLAHQIATEVE